MLKRNPVSIPAPGVFCRRERLYRTETIQNRRNSVMIRIGLDIGGTGIKLGLVNEQGQILRKSSIETRTDISFQEQVLAMVNATKALLDAQGVSLDDIHSIGAGVPGIADPRTGEVIFCTNLGWNHVPFRSTFQQYINKPVHIDNDATVAGLAESVAGISKGTSSSVFLTLGTGVGAGIIINGRIWSGAHGVGSEVGHAILELDGEPCSCGNHGCVERYCSATAIIRMARELLVYHPESAIMKACGENLDNVNAKMVFDAARELDPIGLKVFNRYVSNLGQAIASLCNILDPEMVVLGGGVSRAGEYLIDAVRREYPKYMLYKDMPMPSVELAVLGADAGIIGASMLGD